MNIEITVRKPKPIRFFGLDKAYDRYTNRWYKWMKLLPNNGDLIKITWMPNNRGVINAYIGWIGVVEDINKVDGTFVLNSGNAILICRGDFNYIKLREKE